jgi:hypothetical protein
MFCYTAIECRQWYKSIFFLTFRLLQKCGKIVWQEEKVIEGSWEAEMSAVDPLISLEETSDKMIQMTDESDLDKHRVWTDIKNYY